MKPGASVTVGYLRMARETFCFHGLSFLIPIPKPERKKSSPVVTRSHFCDASNSNTALSQMKAWSLLRGEEQNTSENAAGMLLQHPDGGLLVSDGLDGLGGALVVVLLHVAIHGAQLHLPSEVDIHRALLHCGVDELIRRVTQLEAEHSRCYFTASSTK